MKKLYASYTRHIYIYGNIFAYLNKYIYIFTYINYRNKKNKK